MSRESTPTVGTLDWTRLERVQGPRAPELMAKLRRLAERWEETPDDAELNVRLGRTLFLLDANAEATAHLARATELDPENHEAHYQSGVLHLRERRAEEAVRSFERAVELRPDHAPAQRDLGLALDALGRSDEAREALGRALELDHDDVEAAYRLALLEEDRSAQRAEMLLRTSLRVDPYHRGAHTNLASLLRRRGATEEAESLVRRHAELAVLDDLGLDARARDANRFLAEARHYALNGRLDRALEVCREAADLHPEHPEIAFLTGIVHAERDEGEEAAKAYLRAIESRADERYFTALAELADREMEASRSGVLLLAYETLRDGGRRWPGNEAIRALLSSHDVDETGDLQVALPCDGQ